MIKDKTSNSYKENITNLLKANKITEALAYCQQLLANDPKSAELYNILGIISAQANAIDNSIAYLQQAININPNEAIYHNNLSNAFKMQGDFNAAILHLHKAITLAPNYAEGYNNLGSLYYSQGRLQEAIPVLEKAIRLNPNYTEPHFNLANIFIKLDKVPSAISHYQTVLSLQPNNLTAIQNLAMAYIADQQLLTALPLLEQIIPCNPEHPELHAQLAECYLEAGETNKAIAMYTKALKLSPKNPGWLHNLAVLYLREQQPDKALENFQAALALDPNNQTANHMVQALTSKNITNPSAKYVQDLFNQYAQFYNKHVKKALQYKVPELLRQAVGKQLLHTSKALSVLDLGCGTGLCGPYFRDLARYLIGVDISITMLAEAKALNAYDALYCGNILHTIPGENSNFFDLIIAADVLVYCGDLTNLFSLCYKALKTAGWFAFTVERSCEKNYKLQSSGRFAHAPNYILETATKYNFIIIEDHEVTLRTQDNAPVPGMLYLLKKSLPS